MRLAVAVAALAIAPSALAQEIDDVDREPEVVRLSATEYQVGEILLDVEKRRFEVAGSVLRREPPLEYFAVTPGGMKAYESLLELNATAFEFNLACILIGLEPAESGLPQYQFDTGPVPGPLVRVMVGWEADGAVVNVPAATLLHAEGVVVEDDAWAYTGSLVLNDGRYLAHVAGTLIGFVHDPASIIEHVQGLGIGYYGSLAGNDSLVPVEGTPITLSVEVLPQVH